MKTATPLRLTLALPLAAAAVGAWAAPANSKPVPLPPPPHIDLRPPPPAGLHSGDTKCAACHSTEQWGDVAFAHERTGFPLVGEHKKVGCKQCHPESFSRPVSHDCASCHRDVHRGQLGFRCQGCHEETSWKSRFDAEAHRRVGFPLNGRHAFIPCQECHGDQLNRGFARTASTCFDCHQRDLLRGNAVIDHSNLGSDCRQCHSTSRFTHPAFPAHERCFAIDSGPHAGIACLSCHTTLAGATPSGTCRTFTAACTRCHLPGDMTPRHAGVTGYQPYDRKCYECHCFASTSSCQNVVIIKGARRR